MTSNEMRAVVGRKPSDDPRADMLINSNLNHGSDIPRPGGVGQNQNAMVPMEADPNKNNDLLVKGGNQFED